MDPLNAPPIKNLDELITLGESDKIYSNIDMNMLHSILPYLKDLQSLIGLTKLKESIFYHIIYYLQHLHMKSDESFLCSEKEPISRKRKLEIDNMLMNFRIQTALRMAKIRHERYLKRTNRRRHYHSITNELRYTYHNLPRLVHKRNTEEKGEFLHTIIYGNPGCGKSTVAKIMGLIYYHLGIFKTKVPLRDFKCTVAHRDDFVAGYLGQTAIKTKKFLDEHRGGVIIIDESYSLGNADKRDSFAKEAVDTLVSYLTEHRDDLAVILVGYKHEIQTELFVMNPGLESRFPWKHFIDDYTSKDLSQIFLKKIKDSEWKTNIPENDLTKIFKDLQLKNTGRDIEILFQTCRMVHSIASISMEISERKTIYREDLDKSIKKLEFKPKEDPLFLSMYA